MRKAFSRTLQTVLTATQKFVLDEKGSVATALVVVPVLAGTVALGVETGQLYRVKRQMQSAADAAAIQGSMDRVAGANNTTIQTDARYEAQRNGFTHSANGVTVTVNSPPTTGANVGTNGAVEVIITKTQNFSLGAVLMSWMGQANSNFTMRARSVAAQGSYSSTDTTQQQSTTAEGCVVALTTGAEQGVSITNFNNFNSDCSIMSNGTSTSNSSSASIYMANFNNATLHSSSSDAKIWTRGSFYKTSFNSFNADSTLTNQTTAITDPYASLPTPTPGSCSYTNYAPSSGSSITLTPGTYCGGLSVTSFSNITFNAGTYYIANGDLFISSSNNVSCGGCTGGAGVTFVITQTTGNNADIGGVRITSENNVTLNAPNSGTYKGVLFYQDRRVATGTMSSTSKIFTVSSLNNATLAGAIYFPNNKIDIASINNVGGSATDGCTIWIGRYVKLSSYNNAFKGGCAAYGTTPPGITTTTTSTTTTSNSITKVLE